MDTSTVTAKEDANAFKKMGQNDDDDDAVDDVYFKEFFINQSYDIKSFTYGSHVLRLYCLQSACTDYDLTGQLVWPGAELLNNYLIQHPDILCGNSVIELGSGVGISGLLCSKFCRQVIMTDYSEIVLKVLKENIDMIVASERIESEIAAEKLEWGNEDHLSKILKQFPKGFDIIIGADICFQQSSIPLLFDTVEKLLRYNNNRCSIFILAYVSRAKSIDAVVASEAKNHGLNMCEIAGSRTMVAERSYEGVIFQFTLAEIGN